MQTEKVPMNEEIKNCNALKNRVAVRSKSADKWIDDHASGTLRKNKRIGFAWRNQYLQERTVYEFGWEFEIIPRSYLTFGDPITEGDCHAVTEAGWHIERYVETRVFPEDYVEAKYINVEYGSGSTKEGIGIIVRETSADWIPDGHVVFAIIAEFKSGNWLEAKNPF